MSNQEYDIVIIGGAAAGLTAALYASRRSLKTLVLTKNIGGQASMTQEIENYPGINRCIDGYQLMKEYKEQAESFGATVEIAEVSKVIPKGPTEFDIESTYGIVKAKTVVLAFGLTPKSLNSKGEKEFTGKGVSYCATCDAPLFNNKSVIVSGYGSSAIDAAILLERSGAKEVTIITEQEKVRGKKQLLDQIQASDIISIKTETTIQEIKGSILVENVVLNCEGKEEEKEAQGVMVEQGHMVATTLTEGLVEINERNNIIIDSNNRTSHEGIFAAGDVTTVPFKQVIISAGEGCKAALQAYQYLQDQGEVGPKSVDWGVVEK